VDTSSSPRGKTGNTWISSDFNTRHGYSCQLVAFRLCLLRLSCSSSIIIPSHRLRDELCTSQLGILAGGSFDKSALAGLVEVSKRVSRLLVFANFRRPHTVEVALKLVVRDIHEHVSNVADDGTFFRVHWEPLVARTERCCGFAAWTNLETAFTWALKKESEDIKV
jgi:hypothetical protein